MIDSSAHHSPNASPWQRLIQGGRAVGFIRQMGQSDYYSTDGYGWTGQAIPHDQKLPGLGFRSHDGGRLYHGDVVTYVEIGAQDSRPELRILWVDADEDVWLAPPNSNRIERFKPRLVADRDTQIRSVVNSAYTQPQMWTLFERSHNQLFNVSKSPTWGGHRGMDGCWIAHRRGPATDGHGWGGAHIVVGRRGGWMHHRNEYSVEAPTGLANTT